MQLLSLTLHDTWKILFPREKDYTFFSHPRNKYSRLDYFFLSQRDFPLLSSAIIEPMTVLDHHTITMTLSFDDVPVPSKLWRLNPAFLEDRALLARLSTSLAQFFQENETPDMHPLTVWEAHKCVIRGELIAMADQSKKQ